MAEGQGGGIKGIGVAVTADASQIKRVFNEAIQGFEHKTIEITLTAKEDKSFEQRFAALRNQHIEIAVTLRPTRQSIRDFRKDFNERLAREGGVMAPVKPKALTQKEGKAINQSIAASIGSPIVTVLLEWKWKDGPPPTQFMGAVQPGGGGGGGGGEAWGPFRPPPTTPASPQDVNSFIRQEVARRMAAQGTGGSTRGATAPPPAAQTKEAPDEAPAAAANAAERKKRRERKPHRYDQRADESKDEWTARLLEEHGRSTEKLSSTSTDVVRRANNRLVQIEKRLGMESGREAQVVPGKSQTRLGPKEVRIAPTETLRPGRTAEPESPPELRAAERAEAAAARRFGEARRIAEQSTARRKAGDLSAAERQEILAAKRAAGPAYENVTGAQFLQRVVEPQRIRSIREAQASLPGLREELSSARAEVERLRPAGAGTGGTLMADAIARAVDAARRSGDITGPTPGTTAASRLKLQQEMGIKVGAFGIEDLGQLASLAPGASAQNALMERINERIFGIDEPERQTGFRGGGRATRSAFSDAGEPNALEIIGPAGPSERINAPKQRAIVDANEAIAAFVEEIEDGMRRDFRTDAATMGTFRERWTPGDIRSRYISPEGRPYTAEERAAQEKERQTGLFGAGFVQAEEFRQQGNLTRAVFGDRAYNPETGRFDPVPAGQALPSGELSTGFEGALFARAQLDAQARGRKLPGVGPAAVRYAQAETRDDMPRGITEEGLNYISARDALSSIVSEFFDQSRIAVEQAATSAAGQQAAATTAEALNPPKRPVIPGRGHIPLQGLLAPDSPLQLVGGTPPPLAPTGRREGRNDSVIVGSPAFVANESREAYQARRAEAMETYNASMERFNQRVERLMPGLNDPSLMQYPAFSTAPRQGSTFSPFRPKGMAAAEPSPAAQAVQSEIPDLSDLGYSREQVMAALSEPAMAAGGVAPPPVPPGTVTGSTGGGGAEWSGGVVPVRVTNWPSALEGETMASGPSASIPPSDEMLKMFQTATSQGFEEAMDRMGWQPRKEAEPEEKPPTNPADEFEQAGRARSLASVLSGAGRLGLEQPAPEELFRIQRQAADLTGGGGAIGDVTKQLEDAQEWARVAVEASPARAVATATGQIFSNLPFIGGRSGILQRQREALGASSEARSIQNRLVDERAALAVMEKQLTLLPEGSKRHQQVTKDIQQQRKAIEATGLAYEDAAKRATKMNRDVARTADVVRSFGAGVLGTITGQILFQSVFGAAQALVGGLTQAMGPAIERQMGYKNAVAATTVELSSQTAQTGQLTEALVEQRLAAANMTKAAADRIDSIITERTELMAGNKQIEEQTKLFATASDIQATNVSGLGARGAGRQRFGSDINLYESTGGLFNTSFFAPQQSTQEALGNLFREASRSQAAAASATAARAFANDPQAAREQMSDIAIARATRSGLGAGSGRSIIGALMGEGPGLSATEISQGGRGVSTELPASLEDFRGSLRAANEELDLMVASTAEQREQVQIFADALDRADMQDFASAIDRSKFFIKGLDQLSPEAQARVLTQAADNYARGIARRDPAQIIEGMGDQIRAAVEGSFEMARIDRQLVIPAQRGLSNLANPVLPISGQEFIGAAGGGTDVGGALFGREGLGAQSQAAYQRAARTTLAAQSRQGALEQREMAAIDELFQPLGDGVKQEYLEIRSNIKDIGMELASLQQEQVNIQIRLSTEQFDEQIRQVRRALADARERATGVNASGNEGAGANIGLLERQGIMLSRQAAAVGFQQQQLGLQSQALQLQNQLLGRRSQLLSFQSTELGFQSKQLGFMSTSLSLAQNQRQINFQQALAGFTAPGLTPEERAARVREAEIEADIAQKQQDIAVSQFAIEQEQFALEQAQYGIAQQQFQLDAQQIAIQQQAYVLAQQQYGLSVAQFNNQQAIIDAQNARAVEDLEIQERLIEAAKEAQNTLAANEKTIDGLRRALEAEMQMAGSYLQQASGVATTIAQTSTALLAQFGGDLSMIVTAYANAWNSFRRQVTGTGGAPAPTQQIPSNRVPTYNAPGAIGMVSSPTHMVVGDAGGEMVAILRNPRPIAAGMVGASGGGGTSIYMPVTISGNTIKADDERELELWAARLTSRVEQKLGMRASMFGFGGAGR